jgi:hypothetical protein
VDHVKAKDNRDIEARFFYGKVLKPVDLLDVIQPKYGADLALKDEFVWLLVKKSGKDDACGLVKLADFLVQRHLLEQTFSLLFGLGAEWMGLSISHKAHHRE